MKTLGLFLLLFPFYAFAESGQAVLQLRAFVPVTYTVEIEMTDAGPKAHIQSNSKKPYILPKSQIIKTASSYSVLVTHP